MKLTRSWRVLIVTGLVLGIITMGVCGSDAPAGASALRQGNGSLTLSKQGDPDTFTQAGDVITYTYVVSVDLTGVDVDLVSHTYYMYNLKVTDDHTTVHCPRDNTTRPVDTITCTASYTVTEQDVAAGKVVNKASASGSYEEDGACCHCTCEDRTHTLSSQASFTAVLAAPELELTKTGSPTTFHGPGEQISYSYLVENTGSATLSGPVQVQDDLTQVSCPGGDLAPGASLTCTATYTTTTGDVAAGAVTNHATATAGETSDSDSFTVTLEAAPALELTKGADPTVFSKTGTLIRYTFNVTNTGNVPIEGPFEIQDEMLDQQECPEGPLEPGATLTCLGYYSTVFGDLNNTITNCARARGYYLGGPVRSPEACTSLYYQPPRNRNGSSACDIDPESVECICSKNPDDPVCYEE